MSLYNIGKTLDQVLAEMGYRLANPEIERCYYTSVWVHRKLVRVTVAHV